MPLLLHGIELNPRRERPLVEPSDGEVFHYHHGFSTADYQPIPVHSEKDTDGEKTKPLIAI
jgi:hypothetical protein